MSLTVRNATNAIQTLKTRTDTGELVINHDIQRLVPQTAGGYTKYRSIDVNATGINIKASAGQIYGWFLYNQAASTRYVKFYDKTTAPTIKTNTPFLTLPIPAGGGANVAFPSGIPFSLGIGIGATTAIADNSTANPSANDVIANVLYA